MASRRQQQRRRRRRRLSSSPALAEFSTSYETLRGLFLFLVSLVLLQQFWMGAQIHQNVHQQSPQERSTTSSVAIVVTPSSLIKEQQTKQHQHQYHRQYQNEEKIHDHQHQHHDQHNRFLLFRNVHTGQGIGNIMTGLFAAHLLGIEFNRTVCIILDNDIHHSSFSSFQIAFSYKDEVTKQLCQEQQDQHSRMVRQQHQYQQTGESNNTKVTNQYNNDNNNHSNNENMKNRTLQINNYDTRTYYQSECYIQQLLASTEPIIYYTGNTYPRWPTNINNRKQQEQEEERQQQMGVVDYFHHIYQPTETLLSYLPWKKVPTKEGDGQQQDVSDNENKTINKNNKNIENKERIHSRTDVNSSSGKNNHFLPIDHLLPPKIVIHLRQPDGIVDQRKGLDNETLWVLGRSFLLPPTSRSVDVSSIKNKNMNKQQGQQMTSDDIPFLVTNRVEWYDYFHNNFGWHHPPWSMVRHSALTRINWGGRKLQQEQEQEQVNGSNDMIVGKKSTGEESLYHINDQQQKEHLHIQPLQQRQQRQRRQQELEWNLQMWADWYTLLNAQYIIHTHSDFSTSVARWNRRISSWTIQGTVSMTTTTTATGVETGTSTAETTMLHLEPDFNNVDDVRRLSNTLLETSHDNDKDGTSRMPATSTTTTMTTTTVVRALVDRKNDELKYCQNDDSTNADPASISKRNQEAYKAKLELTKGLLRRRNQRRQREDEQAQQQEQQLLAQQHEH